jgi:hypothetical protein
VLSLGYKELEKELIWKGIHIRRQASVKFVLNKIIHKCPLMRNNITPKISQHMQRKSTNYSGMYAGNQVNHENRQAG